MNPRSHVYWLKFAGNAGANVGPRSSTSYHKTLLTIVVPCAVVIILILAILLEVYVIRHRRLQLSFASYATSHYNRQQGTMTFAGGEDELGEHLSAHSSCQSPSLFI